MTQTDTYDYIIRILRITKERKCTYSHVVERSAMTRETIKPILFDLIEKGYIQNIVPERKGNGKGGEELKETLHSPTPMRLLYITAKGHELLIKLEELLDMITDKKKKGRKPRKHSPNTNFVTSDNYKG
jgi:predicted transcriptional regulator